MRALPRLLPLAPLLLTLILAAPVAAGLAGTLAPAFGLPCTPGLQEWHRLWAEPGLVPSIRLSLVTGLASTGVALALSTMIVAALHGTAAFAALRRGLAPFLAVPHAAAALGLAFLIAPSGWIVRALSPWATGWTEPPDLLILNDPAGLALTFGLVAKELPFLLLMTLAALPQSDAARRMAVTQALGHSRCTGFLLAVWPAVSRQLRLPVAAVLAYAMTSVEMALILGPTLPPTLAVRITQWMTAPDLADRGLAAAAALLQLALVLGALALWAIGARLLSQLMRALAASGWRGRTADSLLHPIAIGMGAALTVALALGLVGLALWSVAGPWSFPAALPDRLTLATWHSADLAARTGTTLALAFLSAVVALVLVIGTLQALDRRGEAPGPRLTALIWLPLVVPQIAFLPGLQVFTLATGAEGTLPAVAAAHLVFVLPYVWLSLSPAWAALDPRYAVAGAALGASPARLLWQVRLPLLLRPLLTAFALGLAVSIGQYLPTLLIGGGRVTTLTTEAVALASGGNRRLVGAAGLAQAVLPMAGFWAALALPALAFRHRAGMGEAA